MTSSWRTAQTIAYGSLYIAVLLLAFALTYRQFHLCAWPLLILFYMLHWRWQGVAFRLDYPRSERLVALVKFRRSATDPNY
jgi:hypothetical protein